MRKFFNRCRKGKKQKFLKELLFTGLILLLGLGLGFLAKYIDSISLNRAVPWHGFLELTDMRNLLSRPGIWVFTGALIALYSARPFRASLNLIVFFIGMFVAYYWYSYLMFGFWPLYYMRAWFLIILLTPIAGYFIWYARGYGWFAVLMAALLLGLMASLSISFGMWYAYLTYPVEFVCALLLLIFVNKRGWYLGFALVGAVLLAPIMSGVLPYVIGGL